MKNLCLAFILMIACPAILMTCGKDQVDLSQPPVPEKPPIESPDFKNTVFLFFNTHLDVGFTDLASKVAAQYMNDIPAAIKLINTLRQANGGREGYVWTMDNWVLSEFLDKASPSQIAELETAIRRGDVVWNGMPYTTQSEALSAEIFETMLNQFQLLDEKYGKKTLAVHFCDVPGQTAAIISPLRKAGIRLIHSGLNRSTNMYEIPHSDAYPDICRWQDPNGETILLLRARAYSHDIVLPDGNILSMNVKNENLGPHTETQVKAIYANLKKKYPGKRILATDLNQVAQMLVKIESKFPVLTSEVGDTWIHGIGSAPAKMARLRAISRLYRTWLASGRVNPKDPQLVKFAIRLGLVGEHTWSVDCGRYLMNESPDKYNAATFQPLQATNACPEFVFCEKSWKEEEEYITQAIALLPEPLRIEANQAIEETDQVPAYQVVGTKIPANISEEGALHWPASGGNEVQCGLFTLQTLSFTDFRTWTNSMMSGTGAKKGMNGSEAISASIHPSVSKANVVTENGSRKVVCEMVLPVSEINPLLYPAKIYTEYNIAADNRCVDIRLTLIDKPANRMAEELWVSFVPQNIVAIKVQKMGQMFDVSQVTPGGNARLMGMDQYVDVVTSQGTFRITNFDVPLVLAGDRENMSYQIASDVTKGVHFMLFNNLWGTNYPMWWSGSQSFRFRIEKLF